MDFLLGLYAVFQYLSLFKFEICCRYQKEFGFILSGRKIYVDDIRVRGIGKTLLNIDNEEVKTNEPLKIESVSIFKAFNVFKNENKIKFY